MPLVFENLDAETRTLMVEEIDSAIIRHTLYIAENRLTQQGQQSYPNLLRSAAEQHSDEWLRDQLNGPGMMNSHQERNRNGKVTLVKVPINAAETLAEGEFNKYYILALCRRAEADPTIKLVAYRGKAVENPRPESERLVGTVVDARTVIAALRDNKPWETAIGLAQPNSGLTLRVERAIPAVAI